jgi:hypothetical protein
MSIRCRIFMRRGRQSGYGEGEVTEPGFQRQIAEQPDGVLCEILTHRDEFTPEAVRAAEEEVSRRGVCIPAVPKEERVVDDGKGLTVHKISATTEVEAEFIRQTLKNNGIETIYYPGIAAGLYGKPLSMDIGISAEDIKRAQEILAEEGIDIADPKYAPVRSDIISTLQVFWPRQSKGVKVFALVALVLSALSIICGLLFSRVSMKKHRSVSQRPMSHARAER